MALLLKEGLLWTSNMSSDLGARMGDGYVVATRIILPSYCVFISALLRRLRPYCRLDSINLSNIEDQSNTPRLGNR